MDNNFMVKELACFANSIYAISKTPRRRMAHYFTVTCLYARRDEDMNIEACKGYA